MPAAVPYIPDDDEIELIAALENAFSLREEHPDGVQYILSIMSDCPVKDYYQARLTLGEYEGLDDRDTDDALAKLAAAKAQFEKALFDDQYPAQFKKQQEYVCYRYLVDVHKELRDESVLRVGAIDDCQTATHEQLAGIERDFPPLQYLYQDLSPTPIDTADFLSEIKGWANIRGYRRGVMRLGGSYITYLNYQRKQPSPESFEMEGIDPDQIIENWCELIRARDLDVIHFVFPTFQDDLDDVKEKLADTSISDQHRKILKSLKKAYKRVLSVIREENIFIEDYDIHRVGIEYIEQFRDAYSTSSEFGDRANLSIPPHVNDIKRDLYTAIKANVTEAVEYVTEFQKYIERDAILQNLKEKKLALLAKLAADPASVDAEQKAVRDALRLITEDKQRYAEELVEISLAVDEALAERDKHERVGTLAKAQAEIKPHYKLPPDFQLFGDDECARLQAHADALQAAVDADPDRKTIADVHTDGEKQIKKIFAEALSPTGELGCLGRIFGVDEPTEWPFPADAREEILYHIGRQEAAVRVGRDQQWFEEMLAIIYPHILDENGRLLNSIRVRMERVSPGSLGKVEAKSQDVNDVALWLLKSALFHPLQHNQLDFANRVATGELKYNVKGLQKFFSSLETLIVPAQMWHNYGKPKHGTDVLREQLRKRIKESRDRLLFFRPREHHKRFLSKALKGLQKESKFLKQYTTYIFLHALAEQVFGPDDYRTKDFDGIRGLLENKPKVAAALASTVSDEDAEKFGVIEGRLGALSGLASKSEKEKQFIDAMKAVVKAVEDKDIISPEELVKQFIALRELQVGQHGKDPIREALDATLKALAPAAEVAPAEAAAERPAMQADFTYSLVADASVARAHQALASTAFKDLQWEEVQPSTLTPTSTPTTSTSSQTGKTLHVSAPQKKRLLDFDVTDDSVVSRVSFESADAGIQKGDDLKHFAEVAVTILISAAEAAGEEPSDIYVALTGSEWERQIMTDVCSDRNIHVVTSSPEPGFIARPQ